MSLAISMTGVRGSTQCTPGCITSLTFILRSPLGPKSSLSWAGSPAPTWLERPRRVEVRRRRWPGEKAAPARLTAVAERGVECHAAIDEQSGAHDIVGEVGGQPRSRAGHVRGLADSAVGDALDQR